MPPCTPPSLPRVVVTGVGMITPLGLDVKSTWEALVAGKPCAGPITRFDTSAFEVRFACQVNDFDPARYLDYKEARRMARYTQFAVAAAGDALRDAGLEITPEEAPRVGVNIGSAIGGAEAFVEAVLTNLNKGPRRVSPFAVPMLMANGAAGQVAISYGAQGPNFALVSACATGTNAVGEAWEIIRRGDADVMITGGSEAPIIPMAFAALANMGALSKRNDDPAGASRPFDATRDGFVSGEGAGVLILERLDHALARKAPIYAEMVGYGATSDAYHITAPAEGGVGAARAISIALNKAAMAPEEMDYVNAHGTSTQLNDAAETNAIKTALGAHAYNVPISSTKSMLGHLMGAAGAIEAIVTVLTIRDGIIHPTINYHHPDPVCDLDYVPNVARKAQVRAAISNSFGFGGHNACVAFRRYEG
jgi:3-oxoacyl-[acyl-carrier-protein] synthase II